MRGRERGIWGREKESQVSAPICSKPNPRRKQYHSDSDLMCFDLLMAQCNVLRLLTIVYAVAT